MVTTSEFRKDKRRWYLGIASALMYTVAVFICLVLSFSQTEALLPGMLFAWLAWTKINQMERVLEQMKEKYLD
jgi:hypothetical protein